MGLHRVAHDWSDLAAAAAAVLISACASSRPAFLMTCSAYELNKQVTRYSLDIFLSPFGISLLFRVQF